MPLPGMTPELEARCRDLGMLYCETFLRWYRRQVERQIVSDSYEDAEELARLRGLVKDLRAMLAAIRDGKVTRAELGDIWVVTAAGTLDHIARSEKDRALVRFGLIPTERLQ